jgi:hypothetical protein
MLELLSFWMSSLRGVSCGSARSCERVAGGKRGEYWRRWRRILDVSVELWDMRDTGRSEGWSLGEMSGREVCA